MEYKYHLQPYTGADSRKTCPNCGHPREFVLYVDNEGNPLHESVGRCNREKCGYHYPPKEFFKDNPDKDRPTTAPSPKVKPEAKPVDYLPSATILQYDRFREANNLFRFLMQEFGRDEADRVFDLYQVQTSKHWRNNEGYSTAFFQIDEQGRIRQCKVMAYNPTNGKRMKKADHCLKWNSSHKAYKTDNRGMDKIWFAGKSILNNQEANLQQTFFGCHLVKDATNIGIVESEKTALICSVLMPNITWIATGGCNGCRWADAANIRLFKGKRIVLYPDSGMFDKWREKAKPFKDAGVDITVSALCCNQPDNTDIADVLLMERQQSHRKGTTIGELCEWMKEFGINKDRIKINV